MIKLETLEILTTGVCCPNCQRFALQVNLNCSVPKSPCDYNIVCDHCRYVFFVSQDAKTMEPVWIELEKLLDRKACPECGDNRLHLEFLCDVHSENCFFMVRCTENDHYSRLDRFGLRSLC